jgi:hypothetical protein
VQMLNTGSPDTSLSIVLQQRRDRIGNKNKALLNFEWMIERPGKRLRACARS